MMIEEVLSAWMRRFGTTDRSIPSENVQAFLNDMLYPTQAPVGAMLETPKDKERGYSRFYNFPQHKRPRGNPRHLRKDRNVQDREKRQRNMSKRNVGSDVFLGGSCNPTTWRRDVAIPLLESLGITYYNPQVAEWTEDLVAVEHSAKESASILFYVLDRRTRNVVGIVEVANFAGSQRDVVLVTDPFKEGEPVAGENISHAEYEELCSGLSTLQDLVARQGIIVHANITDAIKLTAKKLKNNTSSRRKTSHHLSNYLTRDEIKKQKEILSKIDKSGKGEINLSDVCVAYYLSSNNKTITDLNGISSKAGTADGVKIHFDQLCAPVNDMKMQNGSNETMELCCRGTTQYDLYIGGSCFDYEWKDSIALPLLRESGLKFLFAECGLVKNSRASNNEASAMENSKVLLFVITNKTRGLETMALASYYIGCKKNVVLCVQNLSENSIVGGEKLSKVAVKDYNRGRVYLTELASRSGVPVFESISDAVRESISRASSQPISR